MINYIAAACLSVAFSPFCNADRIVACELQDDRVFCAEGRPAKLKSTAETHVRVLGRASTVDYTVRYWAAE